MALVLKYFDIIGPCNFNSIQLEFRHVRLLLSVDHCNPTQERLLNFTFHLLEHLPRLPAMSLTIQLYSCCSCCHEGDPTPCRMLVSDTVSPYILPSRASASPSTFTGQCVPSWLHVHTAHNSVVAGPGSTACLKGTSGKFQL